MARATIQPVRNAATQVIATVTTATKIDGIPNRATCDNASTSLVVRETRSPVPARSTVDSGSETTRSMNCSRSSAKRSSPIHERRPAREPRQHRLGDDRDGQADGEAVDRRDVALLGHRVDEQADDPRGGQRGRRGERVQADDEDQLAAVAQQHALGMRPHGGHLGDGQRGPRRRCHEERHQSSPRITTAR